MRGRLLFPMRAVIARIDTAAIEAAGGYDHDFGEVGRESTVDGVGSLKRKELPELEVLAQVEPDREAWQRMGVAGDVAETSIGLTLHLADLERQGLYNPATGEVAFNRGDRLVRIKNRAGTRVVMTFDRLPVYCVQVRRLSAWLAGECNLLLLTFEERAQGMR